MNALLEFIKKLFPTFDKTSLYQALTTVGLLLTIFATVYGVYNSIHSTLDQHVHDRDVEVQAIRDRVQHTEAGIETLNKTTKQLHEQDLILEKEIDSQLERRVGRLESNAMSKGK